MLRLLARWQPSLIDRFAQRLPRWSKGAGLLLWPVLFLAVSNLALRKQFAVTHLLAGDWFARSQFFAALLLGVVLAPTPLLWQRMAQLRWLALALALDQRRVAGHSRLYGVQRSAVVRHGGGVGLCQHLSEP